MRSAQRQSSESKSKYLSALSVFRGEGVDSGIGAGVDSFFEYLVKGSIMLNRPELLTIFTEAKASIDKYLSKGDWHIWASMTKGQVTIPVFQSLGTELRVDFACSTQLFCDVKLMSFARMRDFFSFARCLLAGCAEHDRRHSKCNEIYLQLSFGVETIRIPARIL